MTNLISEIKSTLSELKDFFVQNQTFLLLLFSITISVESTLFFYEQGLILAYGDAESHINIAKRVISSITPGFGQLGGNWLPFQHTMMVPFVWNDFLWRTGLGGSLFSMISFVLASVFLFKLVKLMTKSVAAGLVCYAIFVTNPGILYMQSTPMGELPMIGMFVTSVYFMAKWVLDGSLHNLIISAFFVFCGSLIRYDLWFVLAFEIIALIIIGLSRRFSLQKLKGIVILFITAGALGILLWVTWNQLIFNDPTYFLTSPYSAKAQQLAWLNRGQLPSYHNVVSSFAFYTLATIKNTGVLFSILALSAVLLIPFLAKQGRKIPALVVALVLSSPFPFYVLTLFLGISIVLIPELLPEDFEYQSFNIRYGLMMVPAVAFLSAAIFAYVGKIARAVVLTIFLVQIGLFIREGPSVSLEDGRDGLSARRPSPVNEYVAANYDHGLIMFDDFSRAANPVNLDIPMQKIIYVGNHPIWDESLEKPTKHIRWFVIRHDETDVIWQKLKNNKDFYDNYIQMYHNDKTYVYRIKDRRG